MLGVVGAGEHLHEFFQGERQMMGVICSFIRNGISARIPIIYRCMGWKAAYESGTAITFRCGTTLMMND